MVELPAAVDGTQRDETVAGFDALPAGTYNLMPAGAKATDKGISIEFDVYDGPHQGRKTWANLAFNSRNETARRIAHRLITNLAFACGTTALTDTDQIMGRVVAAKITVQKNDPTRNNINDFLPYRPAAAFPPPTPQAHAQPVPPPPAPPAGQAMPDNAPWRQPGAQ